MAAREYERHDHPMKAPTATGDISSLLTQARAQALDQGRAVLVVQSELAPSLDPLACLEALTHASATDPWLAAHIAAGRMFWSRPSDRFAIASIGAAATFSPAGPDRFDAVDREWSALVNSAVVSDAGRGIPGVGPLLMGGFAFDADGPHSVHWHAFPSAHLSVPRLQLTSVGDECWITVSAIVGQDGEPDMDAESLSRLRSSAIAAAHHLPSTAEYSTAPQEAPATRLTFSEQRTNSHWREMVGDAVGEIESGQLEKVVLARAVRTSSSTELDPFAIVRELQSVFQNAFVFGCWRGQAAFVGASPERLVRLDGRAVQVSSLAGTTTRGATPDEDTAAGQRLLASAKDRLEHALVRDFVVSALADVCDGITASPEPALLALPHVYHLHTGIRARLGTGYSLLNIIERLHPTPAVGGSPRDAALRFIRERENLDRGWYSGPIGWIGAESGEFAVALRSAVVSGTEALLFAGCGIVADSSPEQELAESELKLRSMKSAIAASIAGVPNAHFAGSAELGFR